MGTEQYTQHDWSILTWVLLQTSMVLFVVALTGLFLVMVNRAGQASGPSQAAGHGGVTELEVGADEPKQLPEAPEGHAPAA